MDDELVTKVAVLESDIPEIKDDVKQILLILQGNGSDGLVTKVALNKQAISRAWWWLSGVSLGILGIAIFVIRAAMT